MNVTWKSIIEELEFERSMMLSQLLSLKKLTVTIIQDIQGITEEAKKDFLEQMEKEWDTHIQKQMKLYEIKDKQRKLKEVLI